MRPALTKPVQAADPPCAGFDRAILFVHLGRQALGPDTLYLDQNQIAEWKRRGYDMDAWQRGERLEVNNKQPRSEFLSVVRRAVSALKQK